MGGGQHGARGALAQGVQQLQEHPQRGEARHVELHGAELEGHGCLFVGWGEVWCGGEADNAPAVAAR